MIHSIFNNSKNYNRLESKYSTVNFQDNCVIDENLLNNYFIKLLDENFLENDMSYNFEGIIIPRYEVLKNFKILLKNNMIMPNPIESLLYSIIRERNLNSNQCFIISNCLKNRYEVRMREKMI